MKHIITSVVMFSAISATQTKPADTDAVSIRETVENTVVTDYRLKGAEIRLGSANTPGLAIGETDLYSSYTGIVLGIQKPLKRIGDKNAFGVNGDIEVYGASRSKVVFRGSFFLKRVFNSWLSAELLAGGSFLGGTGPRVVAGAVATFSGWKGIGIRIELLGRTPRLMAMTPEQKTQVQEAKDAKESGNTITKEKKLPKNASDLPLYELFISFILSNAVIG